MADIWKLMRCITPRQLSLSCVVLATVLAVAVSYLLWLLHTGAVPDGLTVVAGGTAMIVATPMVQVFVLMMHDLHRTNERLIGAQALLRRKNIELCSTRDALAALNDGLEARVVRRTTQMKKALDTAEEANAAKSMFLANMSHELRTPLNGVIGYAQMIVERNTLFDSIRPEQISEYAGAILSSGRHLDAMVGDLLDLSRAEFGQYEVRIKPFCIRQLVRDAVDEMLPAARARGQTVEVILPVGTPPVEADARAVRQILTNLLSNALKYSKDGDTVTVRLDHAPGSIGLEVGDTGIGMTDDAITEATEPFSTFSDAHIAAGQSVGLGLSIVKRLCDLMDATFTMASVEGRGTTVSVTLPVRDAMQQPMALAG